MKTPMRIHDKIREILEATPGLTQRGLAERMGLNPAAINRMLYGRRNIMAEEIPVIEGYLGRKLDISSDAHYAEHAPQGRRGFSDVQQQISGGDQRIVNVHFVPVLTLGQVVDWAPRHPAQQGVSDAFAVYVRSDDMAPRYFRGELVYVHPGRPADAGRDCYLEFTDGTAALRRVVGMDTDSITVEQYSPPLTETLPLSSILKVYSVIGRG